MSQPVIVTESDFVDDNQKILQTPTGPRQKTNRSGQPLTGPPQKAQHLDMVADSQPQESSISSISKSQTLLGSLAPPQLEKDHVISVYETIADHWSHTRYRAWPKVEEFIAGVGERLDIEYPILADLGMGNGKNILAGCRMNQSNKVGWMLGTDISTNLVKNADEKLNRGMWKKENTLLNKAGNNASDSESEKFQSPFNFAVADCVSLPIRSESFNAALSIAVLHHLSTEARRIAVLRECMRILKKDGLLLVYAWALEQEETGVSRHDFGEGSKQNSDTDGNYSNGQDCLVPWHHKIPGMKKKDLTEEKLLELQKQASQSVSHGVFDKEKQAIVYQRYCHVYREGELERLFRDYLSDIAEIVEVYLDTGNWCVIAKRIL